LPKLRQNASIRGREKGNYYCFTSGLQAQKRIDYRLRLYYNNCQQMCHLPGFIYRGTALAEYENFTTTGEIFAENMNINTMKKHWTLKIILN